MAPRKSADFVTGLFSHHDAALRKRLAQILGNEADAADIAQETYLKLYRLSRPEGVGYPRALLFRAAVNLASAHLRRRKGKATVALSAEFEQIVDDSPAPEGLTLAHDAMRRLAQIIDELPPRQRQVFMLHKLMEKTVPEIAAELGITSSTVEQHMGRAMTHCRRRWLELGID